MPVAVDFNFDKDTDFGIMNTYSWLPMPPSELVDEQMAKYIGGTVKEELKTKGYNMETENPDFLITAFTSKKQLREPSFRGSVIEWYDYEEGTLILDIIGTERSELVWRGTAKRVINPYDSEEERRKNVKKFIKKLLQKFPPPQSK
jgi:hypothetical protein